MISHFILILLFFQCTGEEFECGVAVEGKKYEVRFNFSSKIRQNQIIYVETPKGRVSVCNLTQMRCDDRDPGSYSTNITRSKGTYVVALIANNITHLRMSLDDKVWFSAAFLLDYQSKYTCIPKIVWMPDDIVCKSDITETGFQIKCSSQKMYPKGRCHVSIMKNKVHFKMIKITEDNEELDENLMYFKHTCYVFINKVELIAGIYDINVTLYPNISNSDTYLHYGKTLAHVFIFENPTVQLGDCPKTESYGTEVNCSCEGKHLGTNSSISWYHTSGACIATDKTNVFLFIGEYNDTDFYCEAKNTWGWKSNQVFYKLNVIYPALMLKINVNGHRQKQIEVKPKSKLEIVCEIEGEPVQELNLYNGHLMLNKNNYSSLLKFILTMSCESFNLFTCEAVDFHKQTNRSVTILAQCPIGIKIPKEETKNTVLKGQINSSLSILLEIYGYPKPNKYTIIKSSLPKLDFRSDYKGNVVTKDLTFEYIDDVEPYGTLNLTFTFLEKQDFTNYVLAIENGVSPTFLYSFSIQNVLNSKSDKGDIHYTYIIVSLANAALFATVTTSICVWVLRRKRNLIKIQYWRNKRLKINCNEN